MDPTVPNPPQNTANPSPWVENAPPPSAMPGPQTGTIPATKPIAPPPPPFPTTPPPTSAVMGNPNAPGKKSKGFAIFITFSILLLLGIWGYVGYLYFQNQDTSLGGVNEPVATQTPSPTPEIDPAEIQIANGDVARVTSFGETQVLVKKDEYPATGITGFARVSVSPDISKICFESIPPATTPAMYIANIDGSGVVEIGKDRTTCTWIDANTVVSVNAPIGTLKVDIYKYAVNEKVETNITAAANSDTQIRQYAIAELAGSILSCKYDVVNASNRKLSSSNCAIDTSTWTVTDTTETPAE